MSCSVVTIPYLVDIEVSLSDTRPCTPVKTTRENIKQADHRQTLSKSKKYMSDLSTPDKWSDEESNENCRLSKRLSSTPLPVDNTNMDNMISPNASAILPDSSQGDARKEGLRYVRGPLDLTFDMSQEEESSSKVDLNLNQLRSSCERINTPNQPHALLAKKNSFSTKVNSNPSKTFNRTRSFPSKKSVSEYNKKGSTNTPTIKYQELTRIRTGKVCSKLCLHSF